MGSQLPVPSAVPLTFIPSKRLIHLGPRFDRYFHGTPDEPWTPFSVEHHDEIAGFRHGFATITIISAKLAVALLIPAMTKSASSVAIFGLSPNEPTT